jgi:GTPase SAR1 family protein
MLWDIEGVGDVRALQTAYLRGAAGCMLVADGTRPDTIATAMALRDQVAGQLGEIPFVLLLNKCDLADQWKAGEEVLAPLRQRGWTILKTSAKTGAQVEQAFQEIAKQVMA